MLRPIGLIAVGLLLVPWFSGAQPVSGAIDGIGPVGPAAVWSDKFLFSEGPSSDAKDGAYVSDLAGNTVYHRGANGATSPIFIQSRLTNGLAVDAAGRLHACQGGAGRLIFIDPVKKAATPIVETFNGKRFNQPNDLVLDAVGGIYFTDPQVFGTNAKPQGVTGVYYVAADRKVKRLAEGLNFPNGIGLSPDGSTLYVLCGSPMLMAYPIKSPGEVGEGKEVSLEAGGDGMTVDEKGNLYLTQPKLSLIEVRDPAFKVLGRIAVPKSPANCGFVGADRKTLLVTARSTLYAFPMAAAGLAPPATPR